MVWEPQAPPTYLARHMIGAAVAALFVGLAAGGAIVYEMRPTQTPGACMAALRAADDIFATHVGLVESLVLRGDALSKDDYWEHDQDVRAIGEELQRQAPDYDDNYVICEAKS